MAKTLQDEPLIEAHIRDVSVRVIEEHLKSFREFLGGGRSGIYVLRDGEEVYYIGLASSLRGRVRDHLNDHLKGKWDRFDLYILRKGKIKYLRELETLLIRVAKPNGNQTEPNFVAHNNRTKAFEEALINDVVAACFPE